MSYRRKSPKGLSVPQQLSRLCNASSGLPFQTHNAASLALAMKSDKQLALEEKLNKKNSVTTHSFFPSHCVESKNLKPDATKYMLPLPQYFLDPEDSAESIEPRTFYHCSSLKHAVTTPCKYHPRCGISGLFFSREEVVDNLQAAAADMGFKSPFWIPSDHPALASGFLKVKDGVDAICISLTSNIVGLGAIEKLDRSLLHRSIRCAWDGSLASLKNIPLGMNAITGAVSRNPYLVQGLPDRGLWVSQEQIEQHKLTKKESTVFNLTEIEQWELFNADQLTVPGRLGLRKCISHLETGGVFSTP